MDIRKKIGWMILIFIMVIAAAVGSLAVGRYPIAVSDCIRLIFGQDIENEKIRVIFFNIRLPRVVLAVTAGAGLAAAGAAFQGMFSNPLATPDTLGVATGASFGATLGILLRLPSLLIQLCAFIMGLLSIFLVYVISRTKRKRPSIVMLILSGMVISALFEALVSLIKYVADPEEILPQITYWLMGSLSGVGYSDLILGIPPMIAGTLVLFLIRWRLNLLSLNDDEARSMGINLKMMRGVTIMASTVITASVVALCGKVGWIGILIPHISRMIFGNNNYYVIPASIGLGAVYLLLMDTVSRTVIASEIPISILTAIVGAPVFIMLLGKTGGADT